MFLREYDVYCTKLVGKRASAKGKDTHVSLKDVFISLETTGRLSLVVERIGDKILEILDRLFDGALPHVKNTSITGARFFLDAPDSDVGREIETGKLLEQLHMFVSFVMTKMFPDDMHVPQILIAQLATGLQERLTTRLLETNVTNSDGMSRQVDEMYRQVVCFAREVKNEFSEIPLFSPEAAVVTLGRKQRVRLEVLDTVRRILLDRDVNTVVVNDATERGGLSGLLGRKYGKNASAGGGGKGKKNGETYPNFLLDSCAISVQCQAIMEIIYQLINDVTNSSTTVCAADTMVLVSSIFSLYRALAPLVNTADIRLLVVYNDCVYFVHHLGTLGSFQDTLPDSLKPLGSFVDEIREMYGIGREAIKKLLVVYCLLRIGARNALRECWMSRLPLKAKIGPLKRSKDP